MQQTQLEQRGFIHSFIMVGLQPGPLGWVKPIDLTCKAFTLGSCSLTFSFLKPQNIHNTVHPHSSLFELQMELLTLCFQHEKSSKYIVLPLKSWQPCCN